MRNGMIHQIAMVMATKMIDAMEDYEGWNGPKRQIDALKERMK